MKRILFLLLILSLSGLIHAQKPDTVRFYYVLQNPKFYGIDKAQSWFEIGGMKDKATQNKINDTLRKAFIATTEFTPDGFGTTKGDDKTPAGYTDYSFFNGYTYGNGWIRFKDSDSLLYLKEADGYYGGGVHLGGFWSMIADGKLAYIQIDPIAGGNTHWLPLSNVIELGFSLTTGNLLPMQIKVAIDPAKKDSLAFLLDAKAAEFIRYDPNLQNECKPQNAHPHIDSVTISITTLIMFHRHEVPISQPLISHKYQMVCVDVNKQSINREFSTSVNFSESIFFLQQEQWRTLLDIDQ